MRLDQVSVVFMGSPDFAVSSLRALASVCRVVGVVTQPDRPRGRGRALAPPPVKVAATALGLPVMQPETLRNAEVRAAIAALGADLFVVAAYGQILSPKMLLVPPKGCINVHASILPRLRGAAPIQWAVIRGEAQSGISIMLMDRGLDTGPVLLRRPCPLAPDETGGSLHDKLAALAPGVLIEALDGYLQGRLHPEPQVHEQATVAPMLAKEDGRLDFAQPAAEVDRRIRGLDPWPGAFTTLDREVLKVFGSQALAGSGGEPGLVLGLDGRGLLVACGEGTVALSELQLPGRRRMAARELNAGRPIPRGTRLGVLGEARESAP